MATSLDVVIPVLNEERDLPPNIGKLWEFLSSHLAGYDWQIIIADNGSTDSTLELARRLSEQYPRVNFISLDKRGRGRALKKAWLESQADVVSYMDVDLSTELGAFPGLVSAIAGDGYDFAIGSRLKEGAQIVGRSPRRELASRSYSLIVRAMFRTRFRDPQCGFKALSRWAAQTVVPLVEDNGWFFDTEMLLLAEKNGFRIIEMPVKWTDDPDSRVDLVKTAFLDIKGLLRLRLGGLSSASASLTRGSTGR